MRRTTIVLAFAALLLGVTAAPALANSRPEAQDDFLSAPAGQVLVVPAPGVLANDFDPDGDQLSIYPDLLPGGSVDLRLDGSFTFTPDPGFSGVYSFDYYAFDGQIVNECCAHVYLTIYPAPVANDDSYTALSSGPRIVRTPGVLANDDGVAVRLRKPTTHGTVVLRRNGGFTYTATPGFVGTDSFTYQAYSGLGNLSSPAKVTLIVKASNAPPVAVTDTFLTYEDQPLSEPAPGVLANDVDPDGDPLTVELLSAPFGESFDLYPDGSFDYYPPQDYDSPVTFTYRVFDGMAYSAAITSTIDIRFVNDSPTANGDDYSLTARRLDVPSPGVLANDEGDVEGDSYTAVLDSGPEHGYLKLNPDGSFTYVQVGPPQPFDSFTYHLLDSQGAVSNSTAVSLYR